MKFNLQQPGWNSYGTNLRTETTGQPVTWALSMKPVIGVPPNVMNGTNGSTQRYVISQVI